MINFMVANPWIKARIDGTRYNISRSVINLLSTGNLNGNDIVNFIITMFNNAHYFGVPDGLRSVYVHGNARYRHVYGYVMYIRRYGSVSIHVGVGRIRRDFGDCAAYWGWQVLAHEIAHLVGVGGGHYLRHGNIHLSVAKYLLLESLPREIALPSIYYLLIDYLLGIECKRRYSRASNRFIIDELNKLTNNHVIDVKHYIDCSTALSSVIKSCDRYLMGYI